MAKIISYSRYPRIFGFAPPDFAARGLAAAGLAAGASVSRLRHHGLVRHAHNAPAIKPPTCAIQATPFSPLRFNGDLTNALATCPAIHSAKNNSDGTGKTQIGGT